MLGQQDMLIFFFPEQANRHARLDILETIQPETMALEPKISLGYFCQLINSSSLLGHKINSYIAICLDDFWGLAEGDLRTASGLLFYVDEGISLDLIVEEDVEDVIAVDALIRALGVDGDVLVQAVH